MITERSVTVYSDLDCHRRVVDTRDQEVVVRAATVRGPRRVTRRVAKWCASRVHRARVLSPAGDRVSLPCLRPCPRPRARVPETATAEGEIGRPSTPVDWRAVRGSFKCSGAVPPSDWLAWWFSTGRRGVPGGASQSRVSFLLSVFHCVFKFVIYDPD